MDKNHWIRFDTFCFAQILNNHFQALVQIKVNLQSNIFRD